MAAAKAKLEEAKAKQLEAEAATMAERASSSSSMEAMLYHCWAYNPDADFSFMSVSLLERLLVKFQARLDKEAPSETGEGSGAAEQGEMATSKGPPGGA